MKMENTREKTTTDKLLDDLKQLGELQRRFLQPKKPMICSRCGRPAVGEDCLGNGQCDYHLGWEEDDR